MSQGKTGKSAPEEKLWQDVTPERASSESALMIDVAGFEGPLDLLLHLARTQKLDIAKISVLALAEQYIGFIDSARRVRIELAADYLVMAAWLAFLKSKLLLPQLPKDEGPSGEEMAATLAYRLKRLEAIRIAAEQLINRPQLGRDFFTRGAPEHIPHQSRSSFDANLYDLLSAYASMRQREAITQVTIEKRKVWSLVEARELLTALLGDIVDWTDIDGYLMQYIPDPAMRTTAIASAFAASLELVREGVLEIRQDDAFGKIYMRKGPRDQAIASEQVVND
jgi:segregation and condensation protein A